MSAKKAKPPAVEVKPYKASPREQAALRSFRARLKEQKPAPQLKVSSRHGRTHVEPDHPDDYTGSGLLMEALGTVDHDFVIGLLRQLAAAGTQGSDMDEDGLNFMLAIVKGIEPKDQVETMLAAQMAAVHNATMTFARRLNHADSFIETDCAERTFNKLARTFAVQMEVLKRYRTGGEQRVTVEHVTANKGDQAVVIPFQREVSGGVQAGGGVA